MKKETVELKKEDTEEEKIIVSETESLEELQKDPEDPDNSDFSVYEEE